MTVKNLDKVKLEAQRAANRENKPMCVLNLNHYSPLYVVRFYDSRMMSDTIVFIAHPSTVDQIAVYK